MFATVPQKMSPSEGMSPSKGTYSSTAGSGNDGSWRSKQPSPDDIVRVQCDDGRIVYSCPACGNQDCDSRFDCQWINDKPFVDPEKELQGSLGGFDLSQISPSDGPDTKPGMCVMKGTVDETGKRTIERCVDSCESAKNNVCEEDGAVAQSLTWARRRCSEGQHEGMNMDKAACRAACIATSGCTHAIHFSDNGCQISTKGCTLVSHSYGADTDEVFEPPLCAKGTDCTDCVYKTPGGVAKSLYDASNSDQNTNLKSTEKLRFHQSRRNRSGCMPGAPDDSG
jgi:hypothetical protein